MILIKHFGIVRLEPLSVLEDKWLVEFLIALTLNLRDFINIADDLIEPVRNLLFILLVHLVIVLLPFRYLLH